MTSNELVYLEDVEPARKTTVKVDSTATTSTTASTEDKNQSTQAASGTTMKRQISIADMFSKASSSGSLSKRQKLEHGATPVLTRRNVSGVPPLNAVPLNLDAFRASLSEEARNLLALEMQTMGKSWLKVLTDEIKKPYFIALKRWLATEGLIADLSNPSNSKIKIFPPAKEIYSWSATPLGRVRVVIIGQDPYHAPGQAHGLCFSVPKGVQPPPSLKNIYAEIKSEYPEFEPPKHGCGLFAYVRALLFTSLGLYGRNLSAWAANGVLLLNTCLTVRAHEAGSHSNKGWEQFTDRVVDVIDRYGGANLGGRDASAQSIGTGRGIVFLAWGSWAQKRVSRLDKARV
ncbi:uracil-DNA glycosylase-like protein [Gautieria morchelliformis]|nr:uracil-DNA glycosylase-like protein [Gautieria morchelliformis]